MFISDSSSTEWKTVLPLYHEQIPSESAAAPQLDRPESSSMPSDTNASMGYLTPPPSCEQLSSDAPHFESPRMQLAADTISASLPPGGARFSSSESSKLQLPADAATAPTVREFLHFLLTTNAKLEISDAEAHAIAALWKIGDGYQLRTYSKVNFQTIFGADVGCILRDDVDTCLENDEMHAKRFSEHEDRVMMATCGMAVSAVVLATVILFWLWFTSWIRGFTAGFLLGCASAFAFSFVVFCARDFDFDSEKYKRKVKQVSKAEDRREVSFKEAREELELRLQVKRR